MAKTIIEVTKNPNENSNSLIRRFTRSFLSSGVGPMTKRNRYSQRQNSALKIKKEKLRKLKKQEERIKLQKLGKIR